MPRVDRLPDGTYEVRISVVDPTTGKRHQPRIRARSRRELDNAIAEARAGILRGDVRATDATPLREWLETWHATYRPPSDASRFARRRSIDRVMRDPIADIRLGRLKPAHIQAYIDDLSRELSPASIRPIVATLGMALDRAVTVERLIPVSPLAGVTIPAAPRRAMAVWSSDYAAAFLHAAEGGRFGPAWLLALMLGIRQGELAALRWPDIDLPRRRITIRRTVTRDEDGHWQVGDVAKSGAGQRSLVLPAPCHVALTTWSAATDSERERLGDLWDAEEDAVFGDGTGRNYRATLAFWREFRRIVGTVPGLPAIRPHDLRHTAATHMIRAGVPIPTVSRILGHASPAITMSVYAWVLDSMEEHAAETIGSLYSG
jgi:integrase